MAEALPNESRAVEPLALARQSMKEALAFLDGSHAPADIGAHIDHALSRLDQYLSGLAQN